MRPGELSPPGAGCACWSSRLAAPPPAVPSFSGQASAGHCGPHTSGPGPPEHFKGGSPHPGPQPLPLLGAPSLPALRGQPAWEAAQPTARPLVKLPVPCQGCVPGPSPPRRPEEASHTLQVPFLHHPSENSLFCICLERSY